MSGDKVNVGQNVEIEVRGDILTIRIDISKRLGRSGSGKSTIVATTSGNVSVPGHEEIKLGVNCYTKD